MKNKSGIYKITNTVRGLIYIGSAKSLRVRLASHLRALKSGNHDNARLQNSWNKYGPNAFSFSVIEYVTDEHLLLEREQHFIDTLNASVKPNFNICPRAGSSSGRLVSDETKLKMSAAHIGRKMPPESVAKTAAAHTGMKRSLETRQRISESAKGRVMSQKTRDAALKANTGRKKSAESIRKQIESRKGFFHSEETKKLISAKLIGRQAHNKGKAMSDEQKQKLSEMAKSRALLNGNRILI